ncbi:hypothetical protein KUTeg_002602 [Tegillarca granosa]|uniref:Cation efflux protein cytoplasmic domain-containing protein n=1 Tax=Tegillarca granosa TaxID=220873 RepID=A0ABQ9FZ68_TEGGR|nr:hypothetical protein KUTeg_002602 [Tegillarca granosa]
MIMAFKVYIMPHSRMIKIQQPNEKGKQEVILTIETIHRTEQRARPRAHSDSFYLSKRSNGLIYPRFESPFDRKDEMDRANTMELGEIQKELIPLQPQTSTVSLSLPSTPVSKRRNQLSVEGFYLGRARAMTASKEEDNEWKMSLKPFTDKKHGPDFDKSFTKRIRSYYKAQDELISTYEHMQQESDDDIVLEEISEPKQRKAGFYAKLTFLANVLLLIAKTVAAVISGSISIISSLVDSVVDLASGIVIWATSTVMKRKNPYVYPQGRTRLEPVAIVVLSVIMSLASLQLIRESITKIISLADGSGSIPNVDIATIVITASTIVIKLILFLMCRRIDNPSIQALAQDHRNDVVSNSFALVFGYLGSQDMKNRTGVGELVYIDPIGAILISIYIAVNWWRTGYDQTRLLTGHTAAPDFLKKLTWMCMNHHPEIRYIETLRAFHFGNNFLVEVDVILPAEMTLKESHDIAEPLQQKLEKLPEVERAFVHVDYEYEHRPTDEHKVV